MVRVLLIWAMALLPAYALPSGHGRIPFFPFCKEAAVCEQEASNRIPSDTEKWFADIQRKDKFRTRDIKGAIEHCKDSSDQNCVGAIKKPPADVLYQYRPGQQHSPGQRQPSRAQLRAEKYERMQTSHRGQSSKNQQYQGGS